YLGTRRLVFHGAAVRTHKNPVSDVRHSKNLSIPSLLESIDILDNGQPTFLLEMMDYSDELFLKLQSKLDREMRSSYQIMITATDQAPVRQKTGHLLLHVIVEDVNDSPPKFEKSIYVFHVHESTSPGSKVGGVHADDEDSGANGEVTYRLLQSFFNGSCRHTWKNRFRIDAGTGVIRVHSPLDREQDLKLVFQVEAVDHGQPERSATTKVIIFLLDDNDNSPSIRVWGKHVLTNPNGLVGCSDPDACSLLTAGVQMQLTIWVTEWLKPGSVVAFLESWDLDELERGNVSCSVNNGEYLLQHVQELLMGNSVLVRQSASNKSGDPCAILSSKQSSKFYQLVNSRIMDWEMKPHIYIPIVCHDADKVLPRSSTLLLQISVKDENDNAPIFNLPVIVSPAIWINKHDWLPNVPEEKRGPLKSLTPFQKEIKIVVPETLPPNTTLAYFSGYDADDSQNSELLFQISLDERSGFAPPSTDVHHLLTPGKGFLSISGITGSLLITSSLLSAPAHQWHNFKGQYGQENRVQTIHELTPLMRALLSVTVMAGAMVVTVVIFVLVKRPGWIIGRNYLFEASQKVKIDIFQCRTVHNEIDAWPPNFLPLDQQVRTNGGDDKCVIQLETKSPGSITNAMQFQINPQENSGTVMDSERLDQRKRCQSVEVITYPVHIHREPSPITSRVVYQQDFLKKTADDPTFLKCPVYLDPFDERLVQLISHKDYDKCASYKSKPHS
ncbi:cadherin domain protein, partial [Opisthorchis viverrini]